MEQNASVSRIVFAGAASTYTQAEAPATANGSGVKAAASVAHAAVTPSMGKRSTGIIGGKKQRITFRIQGYQAFKGGGGEWDWRGSWSAAAAVWVRMDRGIGEETTTRRFVQMERQEARGALGHVPYRVRRRCNFF